jgi:hypothetical protein
MADFKLSDSPPKPDTPQRLAMSVLIKASLIVGSSALQSDELLAIVDLLAEDVPLATLQAMNEQLGKLAKRHVKRIAGGLTAIAEIDAESAD